MHPLGAPTPLSRVHLGRIDERKANASAFGPRGYAVTKLAEPRRSPRWIQSTHSREQSLAGADGADEQAEYRQGASAGGL